MVQTHKRNSKAGFTKSRVQIISKNNKTLLHKKSNANVKYVSANKTRKHNSKNKYRKNKSLKRRAYKSKKYIGGSVKASAQAISPGISMVNPQYYYVELERTLQNDKTTYYNILIFVIDNTENNNVGCYIIIPSQCRVRNANNYKLEITRKHKTGLFKLSSTTITLFTKEFIVTPDTDDTIYSKHGTTKQVLLNFTINDNKELKASILKHKSLMIKLSSSSSIKQNNICHNNPEKEHKLEKIEDLETQIYYTVDCINNGSCKPQKDLTTADIEPQGTPTNTQESGSGNEESYTFPPLSLLPTQQNPPLPQTPTIIAAAKKAAQQLAAKAADKAAKYKDPQLPPLPTQPLPPLPQRSTNTSELAAKTLAETTHKIEAEQNITHFWYRAWPDNGVPSDTKNFKSFLMLCYNDIKTRNGTTLIHCSAGVGRSGVIYILLRFMFNPMYFNEDGTKTKDITPETILDMIITERDTNRMQIVQTYDQFKFICTMVNCEDNINNAEKYNKLQTVIDTYNKEQKYKEQIYKTDNSLTYAQTEKNKSMNRYPNILPYDTNLDTMNISTDNYINASLMTKLDNSDTKKVILTQCPKQNTLERFNQFLSEQSVSRIIMVTELEEGEGKGRKTKCNSYINNKYDNTQFNMKDIVKDKKNQFMSVSNLVLKGDNTLTYNGSLLQAPQPVLVASNITLPKNTQLTTSTPNPGKVIIPSIFNTNKTLSSPTQLKPTQQQLTLTQNPQPLQLTSTKTTINNLSLSLSENVLKDICKVAQYVKWFDNNNNNKNKVIQEEYESQLEQALLLVKQIDTELSTQPFYKNLCTSTTAHPNTNETKV